MTWVRVSREEIERARAKAAERKAKREAKRKILFPGRPPVALDPGARRPRRKKTPVQKQTKINDDLWSEVVRQRDTALYGPLCRICHRNLATVGYHVVPKKRGLSIRWLLENGLAGCSPCNGGERWNPSLYREKHVSILGAAAVEAIERRAHVRVDWSLDDLKAIGVWLRAIKDGAPGSPIPEAPGCLKAVYA